MIAAGHCTRVFGITLYSSPRAMDTMSAGRSWAWSNAAPGSFWIRPDPFPAIALR